MERDIFVRESKSPEWIREQGRWCMEEAARREQQAQRVGFDAEVVWHLDVPTAPDVRAETFDVLPRKEDEDARAFLAWCWQRWGEGLPKHMRRSWQTVYGEVVKHFHVAKGVRRRAYKKYLPYRGSVANIWSYLLAIMFRDFACFDTWLLERDRNAAQQRRRPVAVAIDDII